MRISNVEQARVVNPKLPEQDIAAVMGAAQIQYDRKGFGNSGHVDRVANQQKNNERGRS